MLKVQGLSWDTGHIEVRYDAGQAKVLVSTYAPTLGWQTRGTFPVTFVAGAFANRTVNVPVPPSLIVSAEVETTRLPMSTGSFGNSIRNGLKTETATSPAIARMTTLGTAMRSTRTIRLWRAATAKRASIPVS